MGKKTFNQEPKSLMKMGVNVSEKDGLRKSGIDRQLLQAGAHVRMEDSWQMVSDD
jgi:hypothetical protein